MRIGTRALPALGPAFGLIVWAAAAEAQQQVVRPPESWVLLANGAAAELLTDRPDFTETSVVVAPRSLQVEGGLTLEDDAAARAFHGPELLLRYGLVRRMELRLGYDHHWVDADGVGAADEGEGFVGTKLQLAPEAAPLGLALIAGVSLPTGATRGASPELVVTWARDLDDTWALGGIAGQAWGGSVEGAGDAAFATVSLSRPLGERWGAFLEWAADFPSGGDAAHIAHHGYTFALGPHAQLDLHAGLGLNGAASDGFVGIGFAVRR